MCPCHMLGTSIIPHEKIIKRVFAKFSGWLASVFPTSTYRTVTASSFAIVGYEWSPPAETYAAKQRWWTAKIAPLNTTEHRP